ncbi:MAG: alanine racemase [Rubricella sp.]
MGTGILTIDLDAIAANWAALDARSDPDVETAAVVKADAYGLGLGTVATRLYEAGARSFFVAVAEEAIALREALGPRPEIWVFSGFMPGDSAAYAESNAIPLLNSLPQIHDFMQNMPEEGFPFGLQIDTGMNRLGLEPEEIAKAALPGPPELVISHLACADEPDHPQNATQREVFEGLGIEGRRSLAATGGTLMGRRYHFDMTRPGIGLYGGLPFADAQPVVKLSLPVIQVREVREGETVGYGATWTANRPSRIATISAGYADGLIRAMGNRARLWAGDVPVPLAGRVSMDLLTVDVTDLAEIPDHLDILGPHQTVDQLAEAAGTIGYEILTSLGPRYQRVYKSGAD